MHKAGDYKLHLGLCIVLQRQDAKDMNQLEQMEGHETLILGSCQLGFSEETNRC